MRWLAPTRPIYAGMRCVAALLGHIGQILCSGSVPQVCRITAVAYITRMASVGRWPNSVGDKEGYPMRIVMPPVNVETRVILLRALCSVLAPLPAPTSPVWPLSGRLVNAIPESPNILLSDIWRGKMRLGHGLNLLYRSVLWSGSIGAQSSFEPT